MATKTVQRSVHVTDPETGQAQWYHKGDTLDDWAAKAVTNDKVFEPLDNEEPVGPGTVTPARSNAGAGTMENPEFESELEDLSHDELDALLDERDLPHSGNKAEKAERIRQHDAAQS